MDEQHAEVARRFREGLESIYGPRLGALYVRPADEDEVPVIDTLIVLDPCGHPSDEIDATGELTSALSLETLVVIFRTFVDVSDIRSGARHLPPRMHEVAAA